MSTKKPRSNFKSGEDRYLCSVYLDVTQDPIAGNNQTRDQFWEHVTIKHNNVESKSAHIGDRNCRSLRCRMSTILKDCRKFNGCIQQVEHSNPSGANQQIILQCASELFIQEKSCAFQFDHVFDLVKDILQLEKTSAFSSMSPENIPDSVNPSLSSFDINLNSDEHFSTGGSSSHRPKGVKKSKAKRKQNEEASVIANSFNEGIEKLRETLSISQAQRDLALQLEKERLEVMKQRSEIQKLRREDKLLAMDPDTIADPERRQAIRNEQQKIIRKRREEQQSSSTTFNMFGMNFDNLGGSGGGLSGY